MDIIIKSAEGMNDFEKIAEFAKAIWTEHYAPIIGNQQVEYMLEKFQKADIIKEQCTNEGYKYYKAIYNDKLVGYCAIKSESDKSIFLSKIYVDKEYRGFGLAKKFINNFIDEFKKNGLTYVWLTVNKNNTDSIAAYKKMGFKIVEELVTDIGNGFFMDDYKMTLDINSFLK